MTETTIRIELATVADAPAVVALVGRLLAELGGFSAFDAAGAAALCARLLATDRYAALLAHDEQGQALGVADLAGGVRRSTSRARSDLSKSSTLLRPRGRAGGHRLLERAIDYGRRHGGAAWKSRLLRPRPGPHRRLLPARGFNGGPSISASRDRGD